MSTRKYFAILTDVGQSKIAEAVVGGQKLNITTFLAGDGNGEYYIPTSDMTAIKNEVWRGTISEADVVQDAQKILRVTTVIPAEVSGFIVREIGLLNETGELVAIGNSPDLPKVRLEDGASTELKLTMRLAVKNTEVFSFTIDPHTVIMTKDMLDTHNVDGNAHEELFEGKYDKTGGIINGDVNVHGNIEISNVHSSFSVDSAISLDTSTGAISLDTSTGDISLNTSTGDISLNTSTGDIEIISDDVKIPKLNLSAITSNTTLPITKGGTGNTTGNAATATKLQTARTLALSGDVTGSTAFDGSANKTITATLKNSGVMAGTYGADLIRLAIATWISNNRGLHSTTATSTWTAKQDCSVSFRYTVSSESVSFDYLNIMAAGTQILANTGGTATTNTLTATLKAGQTIVFTYRKDGSNNTNEDCAKISEVKVTPTGATSATTVTTANFTNYFTATNGTYAFLPLVELQKKSTSGGAGTNGFTLPCVTVDAKGRVTSATEVFIIPSEGGSIPLTVAEGGTGATSIAAARNNLGLGNTSGAVPVANGGTGATSASTALSNLGGFAKTGGTISGATTIQGNLTLKTASSNYGCKINFGDGDYVHLYEITDDKLEIKANNIDFVVSGNITKNGAAFGGSGIKERESIAIGTSALPTNTGEYNIAIGYQALKSQNSYNDNVAIGRNSLGSSTSGYYNVGIGSNSLSNLTTYNSCVGLGNNAQVTGSSQVQLGNTSVTVYAQKALVVRSDARDKLDIEDSPLGLNFIMKLRPRKYRMNSREAYFEEGKERDFTATNDGSKAGKRPHYGLVAQEVKDAMNELGVDFAGYLDSKVDGGEDVLSLGYAEFIAPMIKAIQQQQQMIEQLQKEIEILKS